MKQPLLFSKRCIKAACFLSLSLASTAQAGPTDPEPLYQTEIMVVNSIDQLPGGATGENSGLKNTALLAKINGELHLRLYDDQGQMAVEVNPNKNIDPEQTAALFDTVQLGSITEEQRTRLLTAFIDSPPLLDPALKPPLDTVPEPPSEEELLATMPKLFPIITEDLTPGIVKTQQTAHQGFIRPTFVIGSDIDSKLWLKAHREHLKAANAVGWVVEAEKESDWLELIKLAEGLMLLPANGSALKEHLNLNHYPVLISQGWIEQ